MIIGRQNCPDANGTRDWKPETELTELYRDASILVVREAASEDGRFAESFELYGRSDHHAGYVLANEAAPDKEYEFVTSAKTLAALKQQNNLQF